MRYFEDKEEDEEEHSITINDTKVFPDKIPKKLKAKKKRAYQRALR